ncbi:MAG TPA: hypothetical protein VG123_21525 [Streptosporangiaceae bacterium]|nr:hypothetical protein [Streptosporangiaceae bacterium]
MSGRHAAASHRRPGRTHWRWLAGIAVIILTIAATSAVLLHGALASQCTVSAELVPRCGAWWGMYLPTATDSGLLPAVTSEENFLGRRLDIIERYHDMSLGADGIFPDPAERQLARNHLLLFSWSPNVWSSNARYSWRRIASGALDRSVIDPEAQRLRAFHHTVFLTFAAEPDAVVPQEGSPAQFVAAWHHIHDVFTRLGARNVVWVWTTEGYLPHAQLIKSLYPGSAYVDWISYDPYNYYVCHGAPWSSFAQTVEPFYRWLMANHFGGKPFMLSEFSTAPDPRDPAQQAAWYGSIPAVVPQLPNLKALIQWNATVPGCDLRLPAGSGAAGGYRQAGLSSYFQKDVP